MSGKVPPPPDTPPCGGAQYTLGRTREGRDRTLVDLGSVVERTADKVDEMYQEWPEIKALALTMPRVETKLDLALRPRPVSPITQALIAAAMTIGALSLVAIAVTVAMIARAPIASASPSAPGTQAVYRVP